jgi:arylformamidase
MIDWDDAYANSAHIPGSDRLPAEWGARAAAFRASLARYCVEISYGSAECQRIDLVRPHGEARGLMIFVHGGYWMQFDKSFWTHFAAGPRDCGWAVALPSYTLAPRASLHEMAVEVAAAIERVSGVVPGPIILTGHSAGGHLVARMACDDSPLSEELYARVAAVASISGLHDLRPLLNTQMNETLRMSLRDATAESPALRLPRGAPRVLAAVGSAERPEFIRQSELIANIWAGLGATTRLVIEPHCNHFSILDGLVDSASSIVRHVFDIASA